MKQESLAKWLKGIIIGVFICGLILCIYALPVLGEEIVSQNRELEHYYLPWLILLWIASFPCYIVLILGWKVAGEIGADRSFSHKNAKLLKYVSVLALADAVFFFGGNILYLILGINHPGVVLISCAVVFIGIAISVVAALISHLIYKAAYMQEENELTI